MSSALSVSIVVEWDNVVLTEAGREQSMLAGLTREISSSGDILGPESEVLLVQGDRAEIADEHLAGLTDTGVQVRPVAAPGQPYYELKNVGAAEARGEIVVFLDSDVVPEQRWLRELLKPFADPEVEVVAGHAYIEPEGLWAKAFALAWIFPLRADAASSIRPTTGFFANNVAFRREAARAYPFPSLAGSARGACTVLASRLVENGVGFLTNPAALVSHPAPSGIRRAIRRGLAQGRDHALIGDAIPDGEVPRPLSVDAARAVARRLHRIVARRRLVGLTARELPFALAGLSLYYALMASGALLARIAPRQARRLEL